MGREEVQVHTAALARGGSPVHLRGPLRGLVVLEEAVDRSSGVDNNNNNINNGNNNKKNI